MLSASSTLRLLASAALLVTPSIAQTYTNCNPLLRTDCPPDSALGKKVTIDFSSASDSFTPSGNPTYGSDGVSFTVAKSGDSPQLTSKWYIMFGKVEVEVKAAPGAGMVSSFVLQSDTLDEIDWEWLGATPDEVQTNYFGKGQTTTYNRGAFHADAGSQANFKKYTIDWTANQIVWQIDGQTVRALSPNDAQGQYPQTPMQVKLGAWAGGDPSNNAAGTVEWARGPIDWSAGPFTMQVKSLIVTDYSTGTQYRYTDTTGTWQSIEAVGGAVNSGGSNSVVEENPPEITSSANGQPVPFDNSDTSTYVRPTVYPWVPEATTLSTAAPTFANYPGLPSGWTVSDSGKVVPPSSAPSTSPPASPTPLPSVSAQQEGDGYELITGYDQQGFTTVYTVPAGATQLPKSYDDRGFLITAAPAQPTAQAQAQPAIQQAQLQDVSAATPSVPASKIAMSAFLVFITFALML